MKKSISDNLSTGEENARSGKELCKALNLNARDLTQAVADERRAGKPICASSNNKRPGYFLAATKEEMQRYCRSLNHRAGEIHKTRRACIKAMEKLPESEAITDEESNRS